MGDDFGSSYIQSLLGGRHRQKDADGWRKLEGIQAERSNSESWHRDIAKKKRKLVSFNELEGETMLSE